MIANNEVTINSAATINSEVTMVDIQNTEHKAKNHYRVSPQRRNSWATANGGACFKSTIRLPEEVRRRGLTEYAECLVTLTPSRLDTLAEHCDDNVEFIDPFNHSHGIDELTRVMGDMFAKLDDVRFVVNDIALNDEGGYLYWSYSADSTLTGQFEVDGVSLIRLNSEGKVLFHQDIWDASVLMEQLPVVGKGIRMVRRRASSTQED